MVPSSGNRQPGHTALPWQEAFEATVTRSALVDEHGVILATNRAWRERGKTLLLEHDLGVGDAFIDSLRASAVIRADLRYDAARRFEAVTQGECPGDAALLPGGPQAERVEQVTVTNLGGVSLVSVVDVTELAEAGLPAGVAPQELDWLWVVARSMDSAILITNAEGEVEWVNEAFERASGYRAGDIVGRSASELMRDRGVRLSDPRAVKRLWRGERVRVTSEGWTADGRWIAESHQLFPCLDPGGTLLRVIALSQDITAETLATKAMARERQAFASLIEHLPVALFWTDTDSVYLGCNEEYARAFGHAEPAEIIGRRADEVYPDRAEAFLASDARTLRSPTPFDYETTHRHGDGTERTFVVRRAQVRDHDGAVTGLLGVLMDVTERRQLEDRLARAGRMEAIGNLAAGVAHEINTPLQYLADNLDFLEVAVRRLLDFVQAATVAAADGTLPTELAPLLNAVRLDFVGERIPSAFEQSNEGIAAVSAIVKAMKQTVHTGDNERVPTDLNAAVENSVVLTRNQWKYLAALDLDLDPELPPVEVYAGELKQVLLNLIVNASDAIADRPPDPTGPPGRIVVSTRHGDEVAEIRVSDNGCGIPAENLERIFDLFFTTKEVGRGSGQGLSLAHACIVGRHGGTIAVESQVGVGTTFVIGLPLSATETEAPGPLDPDALTYESIG